MKLLFGMFIILVGISKSELQEHVEDSNNSGLATANSLTETQLLQKLLQQEVNLRQELDRKVDTLEKQVQSLTSRLVSNQNSISAFKMDKQDINSKLQNMAASIQAITNHVNSENEQIRNNVTNLSLTVGSSINLLQAKVNKESYVLAFLARSSSDLHARMGPILLGHTDFNFGSAYKSSIGTFIAPFKGIYSFSSTLESTSSNINAYISRNGDAMARLTGTRSGSGIVHASTSVTLHLEAGDRVWLQNDNRDGNTVLAYRRNVFSGFLVAPDN